MAKSRTRLHAELIHFIDQDPVTGAITNVVTDGGDLHLDTDLILGGDTLDNISLNSPLIPWHDNAVVPAVGDNKSVVNGSNIGSEDRVFEDIWVQNVKAAGTQATLYNQNVTDLDIGGDATDIDIGAAGLGTTTINTATTEIAGALDVTGGASLSSTLDVSGDTTIGGAVSITNTTASTDVDTGALTVDGGVGINGNTNIGGGMTVGGNTTLSGNASINGNVNLGNANTDTVDVNGRMDINHGFTIDGTELLDNKKAFTVSNVAGTAQLAGYLLSTSNVAGTL